MYWKFFIAAAAAIVFSTTIKVSACEDSDNSANVSATASSSDQDSSMPVSYSNGVSSDQDQMTPEYIQPVTPSPGERTIANEGEKSNFPASTNMGSSPSSSDYRTGSIDGYTTPSPNNSSSTGTTSAGHGWQRP